MGQSSPVSLGLCTCPGLTALLNFCLVPILQGDEQPLCAQCLWGYSPPGRIWPLFLGAGAGGRNPNVSARLVPLLGLLGAGCAAGFRFNQQGRERLFIPTEAFISVLVTCPPAPSHSGAHGSIVEGARQSQQLNGVLSCVIMRLYRSSWNSLAIISHFSSTMPPPQAARPQCLYTLLRGWRPSCL